MQEIVQLTQDLLPFRFMHSNIQEILECTVSIESYLRKRDIAYQRIDHEGTPSIQVLPNEKGRINQLLLTTDFL